MMVMVLAAVVVCAAVVAVAIGRGGQLGAVTRDRPPLDLPTRRAIAGDDVALLRLPIGLWGYDYGATDEALQRIARAMAERDTRIAVLEQECAELRGDPSAWVPARGHDVAPELPRRRDTRAEQTGPMPAFSDPADRPGWPHLDDDAERADDKPSWFDDAHTRSDDEPGPDEETGEPVPAQASEDDDEPADDEPADGEGPAAASITDPTGDEAEPAAQPETGDELVASGRATDRERRDGGEQ